MSEIASPQNSKTKRTGDAAFDLNLAPFLDIVVSIIPMLLLSAVFIEIKTIETPIPTLVAEAVQNADKKTEKEVVITLKVSRKKGFEFSVNEQGKVNTMNVGLKENTLDFVGLFETTKQLKSRYPEVFKLQLAPEKDISFNDVVKTMDRVRKQGRDDRKVAFVDPKTGQRVETDLMFPNVTFSNVVGE